LVENRILTNLLVLGVL